MFEKQIRLEALLPLLQERLQAGKTVRFAPKGSSMEPMIRQNIDNVVLAPAPEKLRKYDLPLYRRDSGQFVLHRVVAAGETYTFCGDNQFQYESGIRRDQILALVSGFYRGDRYHSVRWLPYRAYCRLWHWSRPIRQLYRRGRGWLARHLKK